MKFSVKEITFYWIHIACSRNLILEERLRTRIWQSFQINKSFRKNRNGNTNWYSFKSSPVSHQKNPCSLYFQQLFVTVHKITGRSQITGDHGTRRQSFCVSSAICWSRPANKDQTIHELSTVCAIFPVLFQFFRNTLFLSWGLWYYNSSF